MKVGNMESYKRLTQKNKFGEVVVSGKDDRDMRNKFMAIAERLAELEDMIESGQMLIMPCEEFMPAYFIGTDGGAKVEVQCTHHWEWVTIAVMCGNGIVNYDPDNGQSFIFGKDMFLTEEEAEAKLAELKINGIL